MYDSTSDFPLDKPILMESLDGLTPDESKTLLESYIQRQKSYLDE